MRVRRLVLVLFSLLGAASPVVGQTAALDLVDEARAAEAAENYQKAVELYRKAEAADPGLPDATRALAELFTAKGLHQLALQSWQELVRRASYDADSWLGLAQTWSYLDQNGESVRVLKGAAERFPADAGVIQALAWMLFKTEDYASGIALVEAYLKNHGDDRSLEMTLGTLYSSAYDYDRSRIHYLRSIDLARGQGPVERNFRSIAWYNLSLLEKAFHQFELADEAIRQSIEEEDRPAGALALGELYQGKRDFSESRRLYEKASSEDETPLARFDLARLLLQFGKVDEAEAQLLKVEGHDDDTWIYNYGVTKDKVRRDIHEVRSDLHRARFHLLDFRPRANPWEWLVWASDKVREGLAWWYHDQSWKALLVKLADSSLAARNQAEAWVSLTLAHRERPGVGLKYLHLLRDHELPRNPRARGSYLVEEGLITRDPAVLERALATLVRPWENEDRERALTVLADLRRAQGRGADGRRLVAERFTLNPGGLASSGQGLPLRATVYGSAAGWLKPGWEAFCGQSGWDAGFADRPGVDWTLDLRVEAEAVAWTLRDPEGATFRSGLVRTQGLSALEVSSLVFAGVHSAP